MLISNPSDEAGGEDGRETVPEYQTASELFELMTKNTHFDSNDDDSLTTGDLVLLYKNIDIGTKLMNDATELKLKKPNQYVENVVYNDEPESESETSEIYSAEDIQNIFTVNQERLDFLNDKSLENVMCHKFGGIEINSSELSTDYDKNFLFKDPYVKNQLKNLNVMTSSSEFDKIFSTSLIDYICCKRLEDNYNFYMDNIIRYVQHTIEQLKRISNGDYLTERAKEKWREVNSNNQQKNNTKVLATSTSIPLHVECRKTGNATWDDIVHSEVDVRSLSKILEKKIVVEIPKLICGSYRLYSKRCSDNFIISCQRQQQKVDKEASRVDVVLQLQRSQTGLVMSNISSIMVLRTSPPLADLRAKVLPIPYKKETNEECSTNGNVSKSSSVMLRVHDVLRGKEIHTVPYKEETNEEYSTNENNSSKPTVTVIELSKNTNVVVTECETEGTTVKETSEQENEEYQGSLNGDRAEASYVESNDYSFSDRNISCEFASHQNSSESSLAFRDSLDKPIFSTISDNEKAYSIISSEELRKSAQKLDTTVSDQSGEDSVSHSTFKRKSPVGIRIKSPYENKSFILEEKKRKRLLEIRDKKKMAMSESCKITKHKYGKSVIAPQASSSVTKLSITNKSFYNSIYGQNVSVEHKTKARKSLKNITRTSAITSAIKETQEEYFESPMLTPDKNSKKYSDRSYYLDDAETEMMYIQMKLDSENKDFSNTCSASDSGVSNVFNEHLNLLKQLIGPSHTNLSNNQTCLGDDKSQTEGSRKGVESLMVLANRTVPENTDNETQSFSKKTSSSDECRKSIDQLYDLIKKFEKPNVSGDQELSKTKVPNMESSDGVSYGSIIQGSDSGTSVKNMTSSNYSSVSAEKNSIATTQSNQATVVPKVIISSKLQSPKVENKMKKECKRPIISPPPDHPLRAISQLLDEFDNIQKTRSKPTEAKLRKTEVVSNDVKSNPRQGPFIRRRSRFEQHLKDFDQKKAHPGCNVTSKEKKTPTTPTEITRNLHQQIPVKDKNLEKIPKKIADIIDEAKEARGEAVRGPSKFNSRLNSLAQPKKCYVQAHHKEYENRYGRDMLAERLQRLAGVPSPPSERNSMSPTSRNRSRKNETEATSTASVKQPAPLVPHLDKEGKRSRRSTSSSPDKGARQASSGSKHCPPLNAPDTIKKMVAVESYVKSHYGLPLSPSGEKVLAAHRPRAPFVPRDHKLAPMSSPCPEKAIELSCPPPTPVKLAALTECTESSKLSHSDISETPCPLEQRSDSDFCLDVLQDAHLETAVGAIINTKGSIAASSRSSGSDLQPISSTRELELLESALYSQISGAFQKRLRIKNLTLTPKHSMQQMFLVQSGDAGPVVVKSTVSNLKLNKCSRESLRDMTAMPVLSNSRLDWTFTQIPMQIATVGYVFSEHQSQNVSQISNSKPKLLEVSTIMSSENTAQKTCQSSQCFKANDQKPMIDTAAQVDIVDDHTGKRMVSVGSLSSHIVKKNSQMLVEINQIEMTNETDNNLETVNLVECSDDKDTGKVIEGTDNSVKGEEITTVSESSEPVPAPDYTSSLDVLVGLLNEIHKITCQNQMASSDTNQHCADLEMIHNKTNAFEKTGKVVASDIISITSLDNLRQLESNASIYSFYLSNVDSTSERNVEPVNRESIVTKLSADLQSPDKGSDNKHSVNESVVTNVNNSACVDKEVSANICDNYVDTSTDVPSSLLHIAVNRSATVANYAIGIISKPSTQYLHSDYQTLYSNKLFRTPSVKKIIELPQIDVKDQRVLFSRDKIDFNGKCSAVSFSSNHNIEDVKTERCRARKELKKYCVKNIDLDPMLKIKRDILVTVYSILVLTVFTALTFPDLLTFQI